MVVVGGVVVVEKHEGCSAEMRWDRLREIRRLRMMVIL